MVRGGEVGGEGRGRGGEGKGRGGEGGGGNALAYHYRSTGDVYYPTTAQSLVLSHSL